MRRRSPARCGSPAGSARAGKGATDPRRSGGRSATRAGRARGALHPLDGVGDPVLSVGMAVRAGRARRGRDAVPPTPRAGVRARVPILPLGNFALGAALLYAAVALSARCVCWREAEHGLLFALGPLLAPIAALGLLPLAALVASARPCAGRPGRRGRPRGWRSWPAFAARRLPFDGSAAPDLGVAASGDPFAVAAALWHALVGSPALPSRRSCWPPSPSSSPSHVRVGPGRSPSLGGGASPSQPLLAVPTGRRRASRRWPCLGDLCRG